jgi:hypothetical protein
MKEILIDHLNKMQNDYGKYGDIPTDCTQVYIGNVAHPSDYEKVVDGCVFQWKTLTKDWRENKFISPSGRYNIVPISVLSQEELAGFRSID